MGNLNKAISYIQEVKKSGEQTLTESQCILLDSAMQEMREVLAQKTEPSSEDLRFFHETIRPKVPC